LRLVSLLTRLLLFVLFHYCPVIFRAAD